MWPILESLPEGDRREVLAACIRRRFTRREVIFHEGDPGDTVHLIEKGRIAIRRGTPLGDVATVAVVGPGDVVGELALLVQGGRRGATAIALEPTETRSLDGDRFRELRHEHPGVQAFLVNLLARELQRVNGHLLEALYVPVEKRVARRLLALDDQFGSAAGPRVIPMTQDDLASLAGCARPTVNRVLAAAREAGAISLARGRIEITGRSALERLAR